MYEDGRGVPQNFTEAMRWYRMAADQGNATAQTIIGSMYGNRFRDVQVVPQNYAEAVRWYRMAADQGNSQGQLSLGHSYLHGEGVPTNYVEAYKWFALSAAQGNVFAGTPRDFVLEKMTPAQIAEGQRLVAAWRPS
jgi:TPR repeat protein